MGGTEMNRSLQNVWLCSIASVAIVSGCAPIQEKETVDWRPGETREVEVDRSIEPSFEISYTGSSLFEDAAVEIAARRVTTCTISEEATYDKVVETERSFQSKLYPVFYTGAALGATGCGIAHLAEVGCLGDYEAEGETPRPYTANEHAAFASVFFGLAATSIIVFIVDGVRTVDTVDVAETEDRVLGQRQEVCADEAFAKGRVEITTFAGDTRTIMLDEEGIARIPLKEFDLDAYRSGETFVLVEIGDVERALGPLPEEWDRTRVARYDSLAFESAKREDTARAYLDYLLTYPEGGSRSEAHSNFVKRALDGAPLEVIGAYLVEFDDPPVDRDELSRAYHERLREERFRQFVEGWNASPDGVVPETGGLRPVDVSWLGEQIVGWNADRLEQLEIEGLELAELARVRRSTFVGVSLIPEQRRDRLRGVERIREVRKRVSDRVIESLMSEHLSELEDLGELPRRSKAFLADIDELFDSGEPTAADRRLEAVLEFHQKALAGREKEAINDPDLAFFQSLNARLKESAVGVSEEAVQRALKRVEKISDRLERKLPMDKLKSLRQAEVVYGLTVTDIDGLRTVLNAPDDHKGERFVVAVRVIEDLGRGSLVRIIATGHTAYVEPVNSSARQGLRGGRRLYLQLEGSMRYVGEQESDRIPKLTAYWSQ